MGSGGFYVFEGTNAQFGSGVLLVDFVMKVRNGSRRSKEAFGNFRAHIAVAHYSVRIKLDVLRLQSPANNAHIIHRI